MSALHVEFADFFKASDNWQRIILAVCRGAEPYKFWSFAGARLLCEFAEDHKLEANADNCSGEARDGVQTLTMMVLDVHSVANTLPIILRLSQLSCFQCHGARDRTLGNCIPGFN